MRKNKRVIALSPRQEWCLTRLILKLIAVWRRLVMLFPKDWTILRYSILRSTTATLLKHPRIPVRELILRGCWFTTWLRWEILFCRLWAHDSLLFVNYFLWDGGANFTAICQTRQTNRYLSPLIELHSYDREAQDIVKKNTVLKLDNDEEALFGWKWSRKETPWEFNITSCGSFWLIKTWKKST